MKINCKPFEALSIKNKEVVARFATVLRDLIGLYNSSIPFASFKKEGYEIDEINPLLYKINTFELVATNKNIKMEEHWRGLSEATAGHTSTHLVTPHVFTANQIFYSTYFVKPEQLKETLYLELLPNAKEILDQIIEKNQKYNPDTNEQKKPATLQSIQLVTASLEPTTVIFLVIDGNFRQPSRCTIKNEVGKLTYIKKLYDIAYIVDVPGKKVAYDEGLADNINNGLFKRRMIKNYMRTNGIRKKPTLVQKSEDKKTLVLKNEIQVETMLVKNIPVQFQYLYKDKTR